MLTPPDNFGKWRRPRSSISANSKRQRPPEDNGKEQLRASSNDNAKLAGQISRSNDSKPSLRYTEVVRRKVDRLPPFVMAVVADDGDTGKKVSGWNLENVSHGQLQVLSLVPAENAALAMAGDQESLGLYVDTPPRIVEGAGVAKRFSNGRVHVVPIHADWFCPTRVHSFERQLVPHFFSGNSADHTTEKYIGFRNSVVAKYMEHPERRLSINDCRRVDDSIADEDMDRIFRFLEDWGIINYCVSVPEHESWNIDTYVREDIHGEIHVPLAALKSIDSLIKFDKPKCRLKAGDVYSSMSSNGDVISNLENRIQEKLSEHECNYCLQPLLWVYYQSVKEGDVMLCLDCYNEGRFVIGHSSMDFLRVDSTEDHGVLGADSWTDRETVLLLEAVEIYKDKWHEIAKHVGSKSNAQCILHFLRLPVEGGLLSNLEVPLSPTASSLPSKDGNGGPDLNSYGNSAGSVIQDYDSFNRLPFINSENPVIALVAFLGSSVAPRVAAACAHAALAALTEDDSSNSTLREDESHSEIRNSGRHADENISAQASWNSNNAEVSPLSAEKVKSAAKAGLVASAIKAKLLAGEEEKEIQRQVAHIINIQLMRLELKLKQFADVDALLFQQCEQYDMTRQKFAAERAIYMASRSAPTGGPSTMSTNLTSNMPMQLMSASPSLQQQGISSSGNQMNHPNIPFMQLLSASPSSQQQIISSSGNQMNHPNIPFTQQQNISSSVNQMNHPNIPFMQQSISSPVNQMNHPNIPFMQQSISSSGNQMNHPNIPFMQQSISSSGNQMNHPNIPFMQRPAFPFGPSLTHSAIQPSSSSHSPNVMFNAQGSGQPSFLHPMFRSIPRTSSSLG